MIEHIYINGFRSLLDFELQIKPGLTVIVGPNGSGKTNLAAFFEFLSNFCMRDLSYAISAAGGANAIFSQETLRSGNPNLSFHIRGKAEFQRYRNKPSGSGYFYYEYSATVGLNEFTSLVVASEEIRTSELYEELEQIPSNVRADKVHIVAPSEIDGPNYSRRISIQTSGLKDSDNFPFERRSAGFVDRATEELSDAPDRSILRSYLGSHGVVDAVGDDFISGHIFNVIPSKAKAPDDFAEAPGIKKDGSGLAVTLHALKKAQQREPNQVPRYWQHRLIHAEPHAFSKIEDLVRLLDDNIHSIDIIENANLGKYIAFLKYKGKNGVRLPLSSVSDGTVKWLATVTACLTSAPMLSFEEPENFLHPKMQRQALRIFREYATHNARAGFALVTTHSETILNVCEPTELLIAQYKDARTKMTPVSNSDQLLLEISRTGFGLGYYYASDALE